MGLPDAWSSITLGVSVRVFQTSLTLKSGDRVRQVALRNVGGPHLISRRTQPRRSLARRSVKGVASARQPSGHPRMARTQGLDVPAAHIQEPVPCVLQTLEGNAQR